MDWKRMLAANPEGRGDPVTALWKPSGFLMASSYPLARLAIDWIAELALGEALAQANAAEEVAVHDVDGLRAHGERLRALEETRAERESGRYAPDARKPLVAGLRVSQTPDGITLHAFRDVPFRSSVTVSIRPHDVKRDGSPSGPPLVGIEWTTACQRRDERLLVPDTLAAAVRGCAHAWPDTSKSGLTSVVFRLASPYPLPMARRWELLGFRWPANRGGVACFGGGSEVAYLVTLPERLASPLIHRVGDGRVDLYGGEHHYLGDRRPVPMFQRA